MQTDKYSSARDQLALKICEMGQAYKAENPDRSKPMFEAALAHYLELLRLTYTPRFGDQLELRHKVPFILLLLNRDQDAYNFIKWWANIIPLGDFDFDPRPKAKKGEWIYLVGQDIFEDLFSSVPQYHKSSDLTFVLALFLIKSRIVQKWESAHQKLEAFVKAVSESGAIGQKLCQTDLVMDRIKDFVLPFKSRVQ